MYTNMFARVRALEEALAWLRNKHSKTGMQEHIIEELHAMPVYLLVPRNDGFLGALRAVRADDVESAAATMQQQWPSGDHYEYDFVRLDIPHARTGEPTSDQPPLAER